MFTAKIRYGQIVLPHGEVPATQPVDGVIAMRHTTTSRQLEMLLDVGLKAGEFVVADVADDVTSGLLEKSPVLDQLRGLSGTFERAARRGEAGILDAKVGALLSNVRFTGETSIEADGLDGLAAWALLRAVMRRGYVVRGCELCGVPFLSSGRSRYCRRRYLGGVPVKQGEALPTWETWPTCLDIGKVRDYRERKSRGGKHG